MNAKRLQPDLNSDGLLTDSELSRSERLTELDGESVASGDEDSESELKLLPGQMHVRCRKKDIKSPAFR